jgi:hypothetical protein
MARVHTSSETTDEQQRKVGLLLPAMISRWATRAASDKRVLQIFQTGNKRSVLKVIKPKRNVLEVGYEM